MRIVLPVLAATALLSACGATPANNSAAEVADTNMAMDIEEVPANEVPDDGTNGGEGMTGDTAVTDAWTGKWTGPEGLVLDITKAQAAGSYAIRITLLDGTESHRGTADGDVIRFTRGGTEETIRKVSGDETGLKYLAGKQDCLMIKQAEGFCRD